MNYQYFVISQTQFLLNIFKYHRILDLNQLKLISLFNYKISRLYI